METKSIFRLKFDAIRTNNRIEFKLDLNNLIKFEAKI